MKESTSQLTALSSEGGIVAVCISRVHENWKISQIPFYNHTEGWKPFGHEKTRERIEYLAERRNNAVTKALSQFPIAKHILMVDSYYVQQDTTIVNLIERYSKMSASEYPSGFILGASTWIYDRTRILPKYRFYDNWTTPEALKLGPREAQLRGGLMNVQSVGGCYLYPRRVWEKNHYGIPEDLHGCEHNWLCERSELPVFLSLEERLWREPVTYPVMKRIRMSLHLGRLFCS